jgi:hypothetical protein
MALIHQRDIGIAWDAASDDPAVYYRLKQPGSSAMTLVA